MERKIDFTLNGKSASVTADETRMLLWVLREEFGLTGTKFGCGEAQCGACTVVVNDAAVRSCVTPVTDVAGKHVITIEGLQQSGKLHPLQQAFADHHAFQCGFCTPGMIMNAYALLLKTPRASRAEMIEHMDGNLCRCGAHVRILTAMNEAASTLSGGAR